MGRESKALQKAMLEALTSEDEVIPDELVKMGVSPELDQELA